MSQFYFVTLQLVDKNSLKMCNDILIDTLGNTTRRIAVLYQQLNSVETHFPQYRPLKFTSNASVTYFDHA